MIIIKNKFNKYDAFIMDSQAESKSTKLRKSRCIKLKIYEDKKKKAKKMKKNIEAPIMHL